MLTAIRGVSWPHSPRSCWVVDSRTNKEMFVPGFRSRSHVVDVHLDNFPGLEEVGWQHDDALAGGPLEALAPARKYVVSDVAFE